MATRTRSALHVDNPDGDQEQSGEIAELPEQSDIDRISSLLESAGGIGRAQVRVYKVQEGKLVWCENYQPSEFENGDLGMIREQFGAGSFRVMLYGENANGKFCILRRTELTLAENKRPEIGQRLGGYAAPDQFSETLKTIAEGQSRMLQAIIDMKSSPPVDQMAEMQKMLALMTTMRAAMGLDAPKPEKSSIAEMMEAIREMKAVAGEIAPSGEDDSSTLMKALPQVLELIKSGIDARQNQQPQLQAPQSTSRIIVPESIKQNPKSAESMNAPVERPIVESTEENMKMLQIIALRSQLALLVKMAVDGKSATEGAELIYEKLPDEIIDHLATDNWFELLCMFEKSVEPHKDWLTLARDAALQMFDDDAKADSVEKDIAANGGQGG